MRIEDFIEVKSNLVIVVRERGKIVDRREGHNIWLNLGREYLAQLICYVSFTPVTAERDDRLRYMGLGMGGTRQLALATANAAPLVTAYPGTNSQTDSEPTMTRIERPVRLSGSSDTYQAPAQHPVATQTVLSRLFTSVDVSYAPFLTVPLSEIGLFTGDANPSVYNNTLVAYDTFDTLSKTAAFEFEVAWTIRF